MKKFSLRTALLPLFVCALCVGAYQSPKPITASYITLPNQSQTPPTPASGKNVLFFDAFGSRLFKLDSSGNAVRMLFSGTTGLFADGDSSNPGITFSDESNTGFFRPGFASMGLALNG